MCGVSGALRLSAEAEPVSVEVLIRMRDSMVHRGPDAAGLWIDDSRTVGLAHRRLAIIDLSPRGAQPMCNEDGTVHVSFNGEIYNFRSLRRRLEALGHRFASDSDTEVLVHLYEERGLDFVKDLEGDFAFALWDSRRRRLVLARDPLGVKPMYYARSKNQLLFASEIKAILAVPGFPRTVNREGLWHYLTYLVVPAPHTMFAGVSKLHAGEMLVAEGSDVSRHRFWVPPFPGTSPLGNELDDELEELFVASVRDRLQSDVPVGILFSGGVDSTLNTLAFQNAAHVEHVRTYSVGMQGRRYGSEASQALRWSEALGTEHHAVSVGQSDFVEALPKVVWHADEPLADPVVVPLYYVTKLAREHGAVVLQAGEGADELFCGYDNFRRFMRHDRALWRPLKRLPRMFAKLAFHGLSGSRVPRNMKVASILRQMLLGQEFFLAEAVGMYEHEKSLVANQAFRHEMREHDSFDVVRPRYEEIRREYPGASMLDVMTWLELQMRLPDLLLARGDKLSMANSVEVRVPFLDRRLVEFALRVPENFKVRDGVSKEPIKRLAAKLASERLRKVRSALTPAIARELLYAPKVGFGAPIQDWYEESLGADLRERLAGDKGGLGEYFDLKQVQQLLRSGPATVNRSYLLFIVHSFAVWRDVFRV